MIKSQTKIGIFGGSFDPIHNGHLEIAKAAMDATGLERVIFMVAGEPYQKIEKANQEVSPAEVRLKMVRAAIANIDDFEVSDMEIQRKGKTYTIDTLKQLEEEWKSQNEMPEVYFILGADVMAEIETWERPEEVKQRATFVIVRRPNYETSFPEGVKAISIDRPNLDISSSEIRQRIKDRQDVNSLLPRSVSQIIVEHKLYQ